MARWESSLPSASRLALYYATRIMQFQLSRPNIIMNYARRLELGRVMRFQLGRPVRMSCARQHELGATAYKVAIGATR